jgi:hypothetical protein
MDDDVIVVRDEYEQYADETVARVRVLQVPQSAKFEHGINYAFHYGDAVADETIIGFDNHHGTHERHLGDTTYEIEFRVGDPLPRVACRIARRQAS